MHINISGRGAGKTTKMVRWLMDNPNIRYLITYSTAEEQRLKQQYPEIAHRIYYWGNWVKNKRGGHLQGKHSELGVDNADYILERVLGDYIREATFTKEELVLRDK